MDVCLLSCVSSMPTSIYDLIQACVAVITAVDRGDDRRECEMDSVDCWVQIWQSRLKSWFLFEMQKTDAVINVDESQDNQELSDKPNLCRP